MSREERLLELLERWYDGEEAGRPVDVAQLCRDHPELADELHRQIALNRRLEEVSQPDQLSLETNASVTTAPTGGDFHVPPLPPGREPPRVPGYEDLIWIGRGAMGSVYRGRHVRLDRQVALKVVRAEELTGTLLARMQAEARAAAQLDHPHIVKVHEVGECQPAGGGPPVPYIALEYIAGDSLEKRLNRESLPAEEAARMVGFLAGAMAHAHKKGIVHRDLKPDNILLAPPADVPALNTAWGCPKIADFGLARQVHSEDRLTLTGMVMGTASYMAPEQAEGRPDVGPAADVYALGTILYRLLTGSVPFRGESLVDVLYQVSHQTPRPVRELCPQVPAELETVCMQCLEKSPEKRPTAAELAARLERLPGPPGPGITGNSSGAMPSRRRFSHNWLLGSGVAVVVVALLILWLAGRGKHSSDASEGAVLGREGSAASLPLPAPPGRGDSSFAHGKDAETTTAPLTGELIVRVWADGKSGLRIGIDDGAVPVREDEQIQVEVKLSPPAYAYLLWIDGKGRVAPLYPWNDATMEVASVAVPPPAVKAEYVRNPSKLGLGWRVDDTEGLETILVLARREPWPAARNLANLLGKVSGAPLRDPGEVAIRGWDRGRSVEAVKVDLRRGPKAEAREIDDQLTQVVARLAGEFELIRAVKFAHVAREQ